MQKSFALLFLLVLFSQAFENNYQESGAHSQDETVIKSTVEVDQQTYYDSEGRPYKQFYNPESGEKYYQYVDEVQYTSEAADNQAPSEPTEPTTDEHPQQQEVQEQVQDQEIQDEVQQVQDEPQQVQDEPQQIQDEPQQVQDEPQYEVQSEPHQEVQGEPQQEVQDEPHQQETQGDETEQTLYRDENGRAYAAFYDENGDIFYQYVDEEPQTEQGSQSNDDNVVQNDDADIQVEVSQDHNDLADPNQNDQELISVAQPPSEEPVYYSSEPNEPTESNEPIDYDTISQETNNDPEPYHTDSAQDHADQQGYVSDDIQQYQYNHPEPIQDEVVLADPPQYTYHYPQDTQNEQPNDVNVAESGYYTYDNQDNQDNQHDDRSVHDNIEEAQQHTDDIYTNTGDQTDIPQYDDPAHYYPSDQDSQEVTNQDEPSVYVGGAAPGSDEFNQEGREEPVNNVLPEVERAEANDHINLDIQQTNHISERPQDINLIKGDGNDQSSHDSFESFVLNVLGPIYRETKSNYFLDFTLKSIFGLAVLIIVTRMISRILNSDKGNSKDDLIKEFKDLKNTLAALTTTKEPSLKAIDDSPALINIRNELSFISKALANNEYTASALLREKKNVDTFNMEFQHEMMESHKAIWSELHTISGAVSPNKIPIVTLPAKGKRFNQEPPSARLNNDVDTAALTPAPSTIQLQAVETVKKAPKAKQTAMRANGYKATRAEIASAMFPSQEDNELDSGLPRLPEEGNSATEGTGADTPLSKVLNKYDRKSNGIFEDTPVNMVTNPTMKPAQRPKVQVQRQLGGRPHGPQSSTYRSIPQQYEAY